MEKFLVGKNQAVGTPTNPNNVADGAIAIFNGDDNTLLNPGDTISDASQIYFVQGVASTDFPVISAPIDGTGVRVYKGKAYVAPVKQISHVGYTGSGSLNITATNSGNYILGVVNLTKQGEPFNRKVAGITADSSTTPYEIADALAEEINDPRNQGARYVSDRNSWVVIAEVLTNQASTAIGGSETVTVTNGSVTVTSSGSSHGLVAGDAIRIGSTTATTSPVYTVAEVSGATITLTRPYAGASASGVDAGELDAFPDASDKAGVQLTAIDYGTFFSIYLDGDFEDTPITYSTAYTPGMGTYEQVLLYEKNTRGWWGNLNRVILPVEQTYYATSGTTYSMYTIESDKTIIDRAFPSRTSTVTSSLTIAIPSTATAVIAAFEATLNPWMASTPGAFPAVNL
jgi:hypothetical protein